MIKELMHDPIFLAGKSEVATKEDLQVAHDLLDTLMAHRESCVNADSDEAQALVAKLQAHITENYYTCTDEILAGLGKMYVADERFKKNIDKYGDGTAEFVSDAIAAYVN